jgi:uncharacterized protein (DUF983 family)
MQRVSCPSCGAEVAFRSAASVMAVCEYCRSTLLKDAESVKDIGKMSEVLEDYSPIQISTAGSYEGKPFSVVGRIQLRYEDGFWNEWYLWFADGSDGWLSDASGQFVVTRLRGTLPAAPTFEALRAGAALKDAGARYVATDMRTARCTGGQGELPIRVGAGWEAKVADFRSADRFITLDYSDGEAPQVYAGSAVSLEELRPQLLRSDDEIARTAGRYKGKTMALACPSCGGGVEYQAGVAPFVVCNSCHAELDCTGDTAVVLDKQAELSRVPVASALGGSLALGDEATIEGQKYRLIGLMRCQETGPDAEPDSTWVEYLLFNERRGFLWLVESRDRWDKVRVLNRLPEQASANAVRVDDQAYTKLYDYGSKVIYAAGSFNWRVRVGDTTRITDYQSGNRKITSETSEHEINWSQSEQVPEAAVWQWFGKKSDAGLQRLAAIELRPAGSLFGAAKMLSVLLLVLNAPFIFIYSGAIAVILLALVLLWVPALLYKGSS